MQAEKLRVSHCPPPGAQLLSPCICAKSCGVANTPALYCSLSLSISHRIFIKFFLRSWRVFPTSSPLLSQFGMLLANIHDRKHTAVGIPNVPGFPPATYSIKCPSTGSKQPSKKEKENEHESLEKRFVSRLGSCLRPDIAQRLSADRRPTCRVLLYQ